MQAWQWFVVQWCDAGIAAFNGMDSTQSVFGFGAFAGYHSEPGIFPQISA